MTIPILEAPAGRTQLRRTYTDVRARTEALCAPLEREDMVVQTMPDVSPTKWHLAHTTWFFETLVLERADPSYSRFAPRFPALFNSYYRSLGDPYPRSRRGLLSRPTVPEVMAYRRHVDAAVEALLDSAPDGVFEQLAPTLTLGLQHEEQHQELLLMDAKHVLASNPLHPAYRVVAPREVGAAAQRTPPLEWHAYAGGSVPIGLDGDGFGYDNERPRHTHVLRPFELAS